MFERNLVWCKSCSIFLLPKKHSAAFTGLCMLILCNIADNTQTFLAVWVGLMQDGTDVNIAWLLKVSWKIVSHVHSAIPCEAHTKMHSEVDVISEHQEHKLESRFHKDSRRCIYPNGESIG